MCAKNICKLTQNKQREFDEEQSQTHQNSIQSCKTRAILTAEQAVEIFKIKLSNQTANRSQTLGACSVARAFGVSEKAVRDIWNGRTWLRETKRMTDSNMPDSTERPHNLQFIGSGDTNCSKDANPDSKGADFNFGLQIPVSTSSADTTLASTVPQGQPKMWWDKIQKASPASVDDSHAQSAPRAPAFNATAVDLWLAAEAPPLPESSRADDPFRHSTRQPSTFGWRRRHRRCRNHRVQTIPSTTTGGTDRGFQSAEQIST